jgi:hypothetical protein
VCVCVRARARGERAVQTRRERRAARWPAPRVSQSTGRRNETPRCSASARRRSTFSALRKPHNVIVDVVDDDASATLATAHRWRAARWTQPQPLSRTRPARRQQLRARRVRERERERESNRPRAREHLAWRRRCGAPARQQCVARRCARRRVRVSAHETSARVRACAVPIRVALQQRLRPLRVGSAPLAPLSRLLT